MNVKSFRRLALAGFTIVLSTDNLCQLKFVNNKDLASTGNLGLTLRPIARISQTFNLQEEFFCNRVLYFTIFYNDNAGCR